MTDPFKIRIEDFTYDLPDERIARFPLEKRDESKLLLYRDGSISRDIFKNVIDHIPDNSVLVFNDSKVIQARILFEKPGGNPIEIFCLHPYKEPVEKALSSKESTEWVCMVGYLKRWKYEKVEILEKEFTFKDKKCILKAEMMRKESEAYLVKLSWDPGELTFSDVLDSIGETPIPPYLHRDAEESDKSRYQTIYAEHKGSVAAPTAGLHFTDEVLERLKSKSVDFAKVTLHVGAGTFKPVKSETMEDHIMHREFVSIPKSTIELLDSDRPVICVGTTSMRTIESIPYIARKIEESEVKVDQWEPYLSKIDQNGLETLQNHLKSTKNESILAETGIIIVPGFKFNFTSGLITNFHQPQSTLLLLVAAFIGEDWRKVYDYAMENSFRFLSYGDSSLLFKN